jgi:replicative DNA helicase
MIKKKTDEQIDNVIYDPPLVSARTVESINNERANPQYLNIGIKQFGNDFVMARKSKVIGLLGDTSQGKTSLMTHMAREMARQLDTAKNEIGLFVTWEDNIEDFGMVDIANVSKIPVKSLYNGQVNEADFSRMMRGAVERAKTPLWLAGHSEVSQNRPMLTMTDIFAVCDNLINKQGKIIKFTMLDYLQRINRSDSNERDTRMQFVGIMDATKNLALSYQTCVFIGSQVRRDMVEKAGKDRQPQTHWAMETSNFEHSCDGMLSVWMPYMSKDIYKVGDSLEAKVGINSEPIVVSKELIGVQILKQKKGETGSRKWLDFIPEYGMFESYGTAEQVRAKIKAEVKNV